MNSHCLRCPHSRVLLDRDDIVLALRPILAGDESTLLPEEVVSFASAAAAVQRRSAAARTVARELMAAFAVPPVALPRRLRAPPLWPPGVVGSLAHDDGVAVAALATRSLWSAVGVDVEPAEPLASELAHHIASDAELRRYDVTGLDGRRLVVAKEAAYKAAYALDGMFLEWRDIDVDLASGEARLRSGRNIAVGLLDGVTVGAGVSARHIVGWAGVPV